MVRKYFIIVILMSIAFTYEVGETISLMHQNKELDICYASELDPNNDGIFSLAEYNGDLNGGQYFVTLIDMSATWCGPCLSLIPYLVTIFFAIFVTMSMSEEAPDAYKDVDEVIRLTTKAGLAKPIARMKPLLVIKG